MKQKYDSCKKKWIKIIIYKKINKIIINCIKKLKYQKMKRNKLNKNFIIINK